jgi:hypothetical protein
MLRFRTPTHAEIKKAKERYPNEFFEAWDLFNNLSKMILQFNAEVPSVFRRVTKQAWLSAFKELKRKDAERLASFTEKAVELGHEASDVKRLAVKVPSYVRAETVRALVDHGFEPWDSSYHLGEFMRDMSLVYLVSQFEAMLQKFIGHALNKHPTALSSGRALTLDELKKCGRIKDAIGAVIEKEVTDVMQQDIDQMDDYLARKWGVTMSGSPKWSQFRESFYRRNIILHNSGIVNGKYRQKTHYRGKDVQLRVSYDYLTKSVSAFQQIAERLVMHFGDHRKQKRQMRSGSLTVKAASAKR